MEELINKAKEGDNNAYKELIDSIKNILYRVARTRLDNENDIYEAINETVYRAYNGLKKLKQVEFFQTWIIRILINECNRIYKKNQKQLKLIKKLETTSYKQRQQETTILLDRVEDRISFEKLIEILNSEEKIVFVLYFYANYDTTEISKILKESPNTIKSRLRRGKEKVYQSILKGGVDYEQ